MVSGVPIYFQIRPPGDRFYDVLRFGIYGSIAMTNFHVSVFRPSATPNVLDEVMHLGDVKSQLVTPPTLQTVLLSEPLDAVVGDIFYVGLLSVGGTAPYWYGSSGSDGIACAPYSFTTGQWPEYNQLTAKSTATGKTSFAGTETISSTESVMSLPAFGGRSAT